MADVDTTQPAAEVGPPAPATAPAPAAAPDVNPALPADLKQQAIGPTAAVGHPTDAASTPAGGIQVAPTPAAMDTAANAVDAGLLASRDTDPDTGLPKAPTAQLIDISKMPKPDLDIRTPEEFTKPIDDLTKEGQAAGYFDSEGRVIRGGQLAKQDSDNMQAWADRRDALTQLYNDRKGKLEWGEVAETLGHALSRLAAGMYGMRTGYDLSGMKFDQTDWAKRYDQAFNEYKLSIDDAEKQSKEKADTIQKLRQEFENWRGGLRSAQETKARADLETQGQRRQAQDAYRSFLLDASKFDATEVNRIAMNKWDWEVRENIANIRAHREISPQEKVQLTQAARAFGQADELWFKQKANHDAAVVAVSDLQNIDKAKDKDVARQKAYARLGQSMDPNVWSDVQAAAKQRTGHLWWGEDYDAAIVDELKKRGASALNPEPTFSDYAKRYGIQMPGAPAAPTSTGQGATRTGAGGRTEYQWPNGQWSTVKPPG